MATLLRPALLAGLVAVAGVGSPAAGLVPDEASPDVHKPPAVQGPPYVTYDVEDDLAIELGPTHDRLGVPYGGPPLLVSPGEPSPPGTRRTAPGGPGPGARVVPTPPPR